MPYICVNLTKKLTDSQKDAIKAGLGEQIALIPGKRERALMVDFSDGHTMYFAGEKRDLAFVDVRCYKAAAFEDKKAFTEAVFALLEQGGRPDRGRRLSVVGRVRHLGHQGKSQVSRPGTIRSI